MLHRSGRQRRSVVGITATVAVFISSATLALPHHVAAASCAAFSHRAQLVATHSDGTTVRACVGFDESTLTGRQLLERSGLDYGVVSYGGGLGSAVCRIDHQPETYPPSCFSSGGSYWEIFVSRSGGTWHVSGAGASSLQIGDGDAEGFRYQDQGGSIAPDPPQVPCTAGNSPANTPSSAAQAPRPEQTSPSEPGVVTTDAASGAAGAATPSAIQHASGGSSTPRPYGAVAGVTTSTPKVPAATGLSGGLLAASILGGALLGLLIVQLRRRPSSSVGP